VGIIVFLTSIAVPEVVVSPADTALRARGGAVEQSAESPQPFSIVALVVVGGVTLGHRRVPLVVQGLGGRAAVYGGCARQETGEAWEQATTDQVGRLGRVGAS